MIRIKICGLTRLQDAQLAISLGATALGFIFAKESPRKVTPEQVQEITKFLPPFITYVGVFLNQEKTFIEQTMAQCKLHVAQLHGEESPEFCSNLSHPVIKSFRVGTLEDLTPISAYKNHVSGILLDTKVSGQAGGTGKTFDWRLAKQAHQNGIPLILAGGLTPDNIQDAYKTALPYALDLSSGVESQAGIKDAARLKALFEVASNNCNPNS